MRRVLAALLACLLLALCPSACLGQAEDNAAGRLDEMFKRYDTLGACVAVIQNGSVTYVHCYGQARPGGPDITAGTVFQVGSISKMVANIGLMQLLDAHGLSLDSELGGVLGYPVRHPDYPDTPVTLRQLMTHTASLRDSGDYQEALYGSPRPLSQLLGQRAQFSFYKDQEPGLKRAYSNFGGGLIGSLIEALSGETLDGYMEKNVFAPLDIAAAYQPSRIPQSTPMADMYLMPRRQLAKALREDSTAIASPDAETHYFLTAGKLVISAPDLAKLLIALCDGGVYQNARILKESAVREIITPQNYRGSVACESGNGLFLNIITHDQVEGRTMYGHGGKANGMLCAAYFDPADRTGVVMLTNGCNNRSVYNGVGMLGRQVMRLCYELLITPTHAVEDPFLVE